MLTLFQNRNADAMQAVARTLQALAELVDQNVHRFHIIRIERARWLEICGYVGYSLVKGGLEVPDRGRERCNGLLLDFRLVVSGG